MLLVKFTVPHSLNPCSLQKAAKYDEELAAVAKQWICDVTGENNSEDYSSDSIHQWLKDGTILCRLINGLQPNSVKKINESKMAFKMVSFLSL